jgi:3-hydroxyisobutyrate dehydrogenase-like beta-hydroxyacid dehydrogenase
MSDSNQKIGLVGLGQMGSAMAQRLLQAGFDLTVYNRTASAANKFLALGAKVAIDLPTLAQSVDIIFTVVADSPDVESVILGRHGLLEGAHSNTLIVECSTIDPQVSEEVGLKVRQAGFRMMDAPIGGRPAQAEQGKLIFMVGALPEDLELARPALSALSSNIIHCGGPGMGISMKVINNLMSQSIQLMDLEAMALGIKAGLDPQVMLDVLTSTAADNAPLRTRIPQSVLTGLYPSGFSARLAHKDQGLAHTMASRLGVPLFTLGQARQIYSIAMTQGLGEGPSEIVGKVVEQLSGVSLRFSEKP